MLNLLNGDSLTESFKASGIEGEIAIWREGFALGPVKFQFDIDFFKIRKNFWLQYNTASNQFPNYHDFFVPQFNNLLNQAGQGVTLWFEHDLFCQINMISAIAQLDPTTPIWLVSIDHHNKHPNFKGLSNLSPEELFLLNSKALELTSGDIRYASHIWHLFCNSNPLEIQEELQVKFPSSFPFLKKALEKHLERFPSINNGLNSIQTNILEKIKAPKTKNELLKELLTEDNFYGFGDLEYNSIIDQLAWYYDIIQGEVTINKTGKQLLEYKLDFFSNDITEFWLGGSLVTKKPQYRMESTNKLIRV